MYPCVHSNYQQCAQLDPGAGNPNPPSINACSGGNYASVSLPPDHSGGTWFGAGQYGLNCSCQGNYLQGGNDSTNTNTPPLPAITGVANIDYNWLPYVWIEEQGYLAVSGIALTADGLTPTPEIISDDPNISLVFFAEAATNPDSNIEQVNVAFTINTGARGGLHSFQLVTAGGVATGNFSVYDHTPNITGCTGCNFTSGSYNPITLIGQYFGNAPGVVTVAGTWGANIVWQPNTWTDTKISGYISVPVTDVTGVGTVAIVTAGYYGQNEPFAPVPQQALGVTAVPAMNTGPPPYALVTSNGKVLSPSNCAYISAGTATTKPTMPQLSYTVYNVPGTTSVNWVLSITDLRPDLTGPDTVTITYAPIPASTPENQNVWNGGNIGGLATATANLPGGVKTGANFCVLGTNPSVTDITTFEKTVNPGYFWAVPSMVAQESSNTQFNTGTEQYDPVGYPLTDGGKGWGWGLTQISNGAASADQMYKWQNDLIEGISVILFQKETIANTFWNAQQTAYKNWNYLGNYAPLVASDLRAFVLSVLVWWDQHQAVSLIPLLMRSL